jgi:ring-1,2-phenylacetyl-CoA epoxidase subunit PaaC
MDSNYKELLFRISDSTLILGQRLAEWCGHGPILEEDIALTNISLDLIGQSRLIYSHMGEKEGKSEDDYAFLRDANEFRNLLIVEQENGDFAQTIARQYFFSNYYTLYLEGLCESKDDFLREFAARSIKEVRYHVKHCREWLFRLGDGTEESHKRMQAAVNEMWPYTGECFMSDDLDDTMADLGVAPSLESIQTAWQNQVEADMEVATLSIPEKAWMHKGSREGIHTEKLGFILSDMQWLQRAYPGAEW